MNRNPGLFVPRPRPARTSSARTSSARPRADHVVARREDDDGHLSAALWPRARVIGLLAWLALAAIGGCQRAKYEEPEHHVPAHRPVDFPAAVARLETLHQWFLTGGDIKEGALTGDARISDAIDPFDEFHDVTRWLPELAGDSDLAEVEWGRVNGQSRTLVGAFASVRSAAAAARTSSYQMRRELFESGLRELRAVADAFPRGKVEEARE